MVTLHPLAEPELLALPADMRARFLHITEMLEDFGPQRVGLPHIRPLESKLWEMRMKGRDVFNIYLGPSCTPESLIQDVEGCYPLTHHFQQLALNELEDVQARLEDDESLTPFERKRLEDLAEALCDADDGWAAWLLLEGTMGLPRFEGEVEDWLDSPIESNDIEWFHIRSGAQGQAKAFFESLPFDELNALGVVIVEGDHPGSTYYAAELRQPIAGANVVAADMGLPFRFRGEGSTQPMGDA